MLVEIALEMPGLELFHTRDGEGFVVIPAGDHNELWSLRGGPVRRWLSGRYFAQEASAPNAQALQDAIGVLEGKATFEGGQHEVHLRVAQDDVGAIYLDLADDHWQAVRIDAAGWEVVHDPPVKFRRTRGMRPLPNPMAGGAVDELRDYVNVHDEEWPLLVALLVAALRPKGPFPVAAVHGEQGSAKSTTVRVLRELIDPNVAALRSEPRSGQDLMIAARNGWLLAFDNMSTLPPWLSDALCRLSTGGGFATRELYSDSDEVLIDVQRPVAVNGIAELATRGDLLDRAVVLSLPRIDRYRTEDEFWPAFEQARPRILGALLHAVSTALANVKNVTLDRPPRMADFARWSVAAEPALAIGRGAFLAAYRSNRADAAAIALESSPLAQPLRTLADVGYVGSATELLRRLADLAGDDATHRQGWPKSASALAAQLRRLAPDLRRTGLNIDFDRDVDRARSRLITLRTVPETSVQSVQSVQQGDGADGADGESRARSNGHDAAQQVTLETTL